MEQDQGESMARSLQPKVFLVGRVALETDGRIVDEAQFPGRQGRLTFAYLVAEQGRAVPRDELAEALWGEAPPATWDKALTGIVSKLRSLLADQGIDGASVLTGAFGCYRLELPEGSWVDVLAAATAADEAEAALAAGELDRAKDAAALAASLLRQPFLPGEDGDVGRAEAARARRAPRACVQCAGRGVPAFRRRAGGGEVGRADDRARPVPGDGLPASDGGARRRRRPGGGLARVRALPSAPRGRARDVPVTGDRVDLPRAPRGAGTQRSSKAGGRATTTRCGCARARPRARAPRPAATRLYARRRGTRGRGSYRCNGRNRGTRRPRPGRSQQSRPIRSGSSAHAPAACAGRFRWGHRRARSRPGTARSGSQTAMRTPSPGSIRQHGR